MLRSSVMLLLLVVLPVVPLAFAEEPARPCELLAQDIEDQFHNANHCRTEKDCFALPIPADQEGPACYSFVHEDEDEAQLLQKVNEFLDRKCGPLKIHCASRPSALCIRNRCMERRAAGAILASVFSEEK